MIGSALPRLVAVLLLSVLASAAPLQSQPPAPHSDRPWPPPGVARENKDGITPPKLLHQVGPQYTSEAMRERIEGTIGLECVVETDGTVHRLRVIQSLDKLYGLDNGALRAVKQWRFTPGTKDGVVVPVLITIDMAFTLYPKVPPTPPALPAPR